MSEINKIKIPKNYSINVHAVKNLDKFIEKIP